MSIEDIVARRFRHPRLAPLVAAVTAHFGITEAALFSRARSSTVVRARDALIVDLYAMGYSTPEIGALIDRDHTTVLAAIHKYTRGPAKARLRAMANARAS